MPDNRFHTVNLLPISYQDQQTTKKLKKLLAQVTVGAVFLSGIIVGGAYLKDYTAIQNNKKIETEIENVRLSKENYREIIDLQDNIDNLVSIRANITKNEVDWSNFIQSINASLQKGMTIGSLNAISVLTEVEEESLIEEDGVTADIDETPIENFLEIKVTLSVEDLESLNSLKNSLNRIDGLKAADFSIATKTSEDGTYNVEMSMIFDENARWNRFEEITNE